MNSRTDTQPASLRRVQNPKKVLLVEDCENDAELVRMVLSEASPTSELTIVRNGMEALNYLFRRGEFRARQGGNPDLVLLDLEMPGLSGLHVLQQVKIDGALTSVPVVMLSGLGDPEARRHCYECGANAYILKPTDFQELQRVVRQIAVFYLEINIPPPPTVARVLVRSRQRNVRQPAFRAR